MQRPPLSGRPSLGNAAAKATNYTTPPAAFDAESPSPLDRLKRDSTAIARNESLNALLGKTAPPTPAAASSSRPPLKPAKPAATSPSQSPGSFASRSVASTKMPANGDDPLGVGDMVEVPGGMLGTVKFIGSVEGKSGVFAGVELTKEYATRGKNDGDVDGINYFTTTVPGSGIFLPAHRAVKQDSPTRTASVASPTPTTPSVSNIDQASRNVGIPNATTPPTPSVSKFSRSIGPGSRPNFSQSVGPGASPALKPKPRSSLARPESPFRRQAPPLQSTPSASRSSTGLNASVRGGRPSTAGSTTTTPAKITSGAPKTPNPARSPSRSQSRNQDYATISEDGESTPTPGIARMTNGFNSSIRGRPRPFSSGQNNEELQMLRDRLAERDKQLKEQASSLADMENSLAELQTLMAQNSMNGGLKSPADGAQDDPDGPQLRALLREKNDRIATLTTEFDSHRADFRSTIDTLEMASTETERVYEKRVEELLLEVNELRGRGQDVDIVANQLKQLEDLVQELEEGLEDARRGEAEARGEVEFLRGEVERSRSELKREREKAAAALKTADAAVGDRAMSPGGSQIIEQRDDEIRGLKAIIHSLSAGPEAGSPSLEKSNSMGDGTSSEEVNQLREAMERLQREKGELEGLVDRKTFREEELERELSRLREMGRNGALDPSMLRDSVISNGGQSVRTVISADGRPFSQHSAKQSSEGLRPSGHRRQDTAVLAPTEESIPSSSVTSDTLWCEICETAGHDILTCTDIGGGATQSSTTAADDYDDANPTPVAAAAEDAEQDTTQRTAFYTSPKSPQSPNGDAFKPLHQRTGKDVVNDVFKNGLVSPRRTSSREEPSRPPVAALPLPPDGDGPAAGKASGVIDMARWCAMCERDGHESVDCPFEEDY